MKHPARLGAALAAIAFAAPAAPALAEGFTLDLAAQSDAVVGRPLLLQATGTIPPEDVAFPYWFSLDAIPTAVTTTCPPDHFEGAQFANANGGAVVTFAQGERPDAAGRFNVPVAVTPTAPGSLLLCGYTDDGETLTLAGASLLLDIKPAPAAVSRPPSPAAYTAAGIKSCRALLAGADARSCVRKIVRKAERRCHRRASCLRAVHRAARRT